MCCADFNYYINRQGIQGRKGEKGDKGFSPTINVSTDTVDEYKLIIANEDNTFETPNLRGNINVLDNGGTYLRYDKETQQISAQDMDAATANTLGGVRLSTEENITAMSADTVVTPADVADALPVYLEPAGDVTITQNEETSKTKIGVDLSGVRTDISNITADLNTAKAEIVDVQNSVNGKQDKLTAGEGITIDENNVISSSTTTGDVSSTGDNMFTGDNTFTKTVITSANNAIDLNGYKSSWSSSGNVTYTRGADGISQATRHSTEITDLNTGETHLTSLMKDVTISATGDLILKANDNTYSGNLGITNVPRIKDGNGNVILSQGNVTAGNNITIEKTDAGIKISSTASGGAAIDDANISTTTVYSSDKTVNLATSLVDNAMITLNQTKQDTLVSGTNIKTINGQSILGEGDITVGGSTPTNMVTTDTEQTITGAKRFYNGITFGNPNGFRGELQPGYLSLGDGGPANLYLKADSKAPQINFYGALNIGAGSSDSSITLSSYYSNLKIATDTLKFTKRDGTVVDLLNQSGGSTIIDDTTASTTTTYSSSKIDALIGNISTVLDSINGEVI